MLLKRGDNGDEVKTLQLKLKAAGYDPGDIDGNFGGKTEAALLAFQTDRPDVNDDKVYGPRTAGALDQALAKRDKEKTLANPQAPAPAPCNKEVWDEFLATMATICNHPVMYGPGRGLWVNGQFLITYNPGSQVKGDNWKSWPNVKSKPYASFHCTSYVNFIASWLQKRNQDYTHAGNCISFFDLMEKGPEVRFWPGVGPVCGFGNCMTSIAPDGSGTKRSGFAHAMDLQEIYDRRASLPTFLFFVQSTKKAGYWNKWHHTGLYVVDHNDNHRLYRWAADGYKGAGGYSATPMQKLEIVPGNIKTLGPVVYRLYGMNTIDGTYGDPSRTFAKISFESV